MFLVCFVLFSDEGHRLWPKRHSLLFSFWVGIWDNCIYILLCPNREFLFASTQLACCVNLACKSPVRSFRQMSQVFWESLYIPVWSRCSSSGRYRTPNLRGCRHLFDAKVSAHLKQMCDWGRNSANKFYAPCWCKTDSFSASHHCDSTTPLLYLSGDEFSQCNHPKEQLL